MLFVLVLLLFFWLAENINIQITNIEMAKVNWWLTGFDYGEELLMIGDPIIIIIITSIANV